MRQDTAVIAVDLVQRGKTPPRERIDETPVVSAVCRRMHALSYLVTRELGQCLSVTVP